MKHWPSAPCVTKHWKPTNGSSPHPSGAALTPGSAERFGLWMADTQHSARFTTETGVEGAALRHRGVREWMVRVVAALGIFAIVVAGLGATIAVIMSSKQQTPAARTALPTPPPFTPQVPTPVEFQLNLVVTDQNCTVPAGCVYKYRVEPKYIGLHPLPDKEFKVIYQVTGGISPKPETSPSRATRPGCCRTCPSRDHQGHTCTRR